MAVLGRGLDQVSGLLDAVTDDDLTAPTPCAEWTVSELADHLVMVAAKFAQSVRGEKVDWTQPAPPVATDRAAAFRAAAGELRAAWVEKGSGAEPGPQWQCGELAVHTWDLATALGRRSGDLDPEVAEAGLVFMRANLRPEIRGDAFRPELPAPEGADAYQRIAALAGRSV